MRGKPGEHGDVQPRDRHQVGHAGGAEHIPVAAVDGALVAGHECGDDAGLPRVGHALEHRIAHRLPRTLDRMQPCGLQACRRGIAGAGSHIAAGMHALLPEPQFAVEAVRIEIAVRRLEPHREAPALARMQRGRVAGGGTAFRGAPPERAVLAVPAERDARRNAWRSPGAPIRPARRFHIEPKARAALVALGHLRDHAHHLQVAAFEGRVERARCVDRRAPAREPAGGKRSAGQRKGHRKPCWHAKVPSPSTRQHRQPRKAREEQRRIGTRAPQPRLLQLQGRAEQRSAQRSKGPRRRRGAAGWTCRPHRPTPEHMMQTLPMLTLSGALIALLLG